MSDTSQFTVYMEKGTHKKLKTLAFLQDKTLKALYTEITEEYVKKHDEILKNLRFKG